MKIQFTIVGLIAILVLKSQLGNSQNKISFGDVSLQELQMTSYEKDLTAGAVVLSDIGKLNGNDARFTRHIRVKILNKSGLDWGNWVFNTPTKGDFKVHVFNLVDGEIIKEKAESSSIYKDEIVENFYVFKVFAPSVRVGSVIDIFYSFTGIPYEWRFQERIPIVYSELTMEQTQFASYSKNFFGFENIETISTNKWRARDMPAFKIEPYLSDYSNYITKFEFQVTTFGRPGYRFYLEYSTSWRNIIGNLMNKIPNFGGVLKGYDFLNDFAKETKSKDLTINEKINLAYEYIQKNLKWNGSKSAFTTSKLRENFLKNHTGNSAEINLTLIALLNKMDIKTYPVVLSTRENGFLIPHNPTFNKLNYVVGFVQYDSIEMFLDGTSDNLVPGILPAYCLNGNGLLVKEENEQWLNLNRSYRDIKKHYAVVNITSDAKATAKINQEYTGYGFLNWAEEQKQINHDYDVQKNKLQDEYPDIDILTYEVSKNDVKNISSKESMQIDLSSQLLDAGDGYIFSPFMMFEYTKNPFRSEERKHPVDLIYPKDLNTTIVIQLPKEFSLKQLPESVRFSVPDGSASFTYLANVNASGVQFRTILKIDKYIFTETEYLDLRLFFSEVSKKINTPIELIKN